MGLLDGFGNLDPEQTQGLLAAAAQMLQQSGPSLMPHSFGQIAGGGLGAYQGGVDAARRRKQEEAQAAQANLLRGLQIQEAQGGLADHDRARQQADLLRQFYTQQGTGGAAAPAQAGGAPPQLSSMPMASMPGMAQLPQQGQQGAQQPAGDPYGQRMAMAQHLRSAGFHAEADAQEAAALKFQPKFATEFRQAVGADGKLHNYQVSEDGQIKEVPLGVKPDMVSTSLGGTTRWDDKNALAPGQQFKHTMTPGESASNSLGRDRLSFDKQQADRPAFNYDAGGFVSRPTAANPGGSLTPLAGLGAKPGTEFQGKSAAFGLRATEADKILTSLRDQGATGLGMVASDRPGALKGMAESVPWIGGGLGAAVNVLPSALGGPNANQQRAEQAQRDFVNAILRQESGASISPSEFDSARKQYFPQAGDTDEVIAQKATNRQLAVQGLQANAGRAALTAPKPAGQWSITRKD